MHPGRLTPQALFLVLLAIGLILLLITAYQHRRHARRTDVRTCAGCGTGNPGFAEYCRHCGRKV